MNKRRLFIAALTFLVLAFGASAVCAQEGSSNIARSDEGETVLYTYNLNAGSNIGALDVVFSYRGDVLEFAEIIPGPLGDITDGILVTNPLPEEMKIHSNYVTTTPVEAGGTLFHMRFRKLQETGDQVVIGVDLRGQNRIDGSVIEQKVITGDSTVALVNSDKSINDPDSGAVPLGAVADVVPTVEEPVVEVNPTADSDTAVKEAREAEATTEAIKQNNLPIMIGITVVCLALIVGLGYYRFILYKRADGQKKDREKDAFLDKHH